MLTCDELGIPQRLRTTPEKQIDPEFEKDDFLYRWFSPDIEIEEDKISASMFKNIFSPPFDISVNRSFYCKYETDVLYNTKALPHLIDHGVMRADVKQVKEVSFTSNNSKITFTVKHEPAICMYPHTIIEISQDNVPIKSKIRNRTLKADIRENLGKLFSVCHSPSSEFSLPKEGAKTQEKQTYLKWAQKYIKQLWQKILNLFGSTGFI